MTDEFAIEVCDLKMKFGDVIVLNNITLKIKKGENVVILGRSGCGKSVLIKCIVGLIVPDEGKIVLLSETLSSLDEKQLNVLRKKVGFLFQSSALYDSMTVEDNLKFPLRGLNTFSMEKKNSLVLESLKSVGLDDAIHKMPSELSGGMKKRIGLARSLVLQPEIIFYDEPTTGLDPITSKEISHLILEIQKKNNTTSVIITHDIECARVTANRILMIRDGVFVAEGSFKELSESKDPWVSAFFQ